MGVRCETCGHIRQWSSPSHYPDCARARSMRLHPTGRFLDECPAHGGEDRLDCAACEALADEMREPLRPLEAI